MNRQLNATLEEMARALFKSWFVDFDPVRRNDWLAVNQFTVTDVNLTSRAKTKRTPDIVLFGNGIPLAVIELKNAADENTTIEQAYNQLQTYKEDIPTLMVTNCSLVIADGPQARLGTMTGGMEWFKQWRTIDGQVSGSLEQRFAVVHSGEGAVKITVP
jgi:type I restriction enzyme R subunit